MYSHSREECRLSYQATTFWGGVTLTVSYYCGSSFFTLPVILCFGYKFHLILPFSIASHQDSITSKSLLKHNCHTLSLHILSLNTPSLLQGKKCPTTATASLLFILHHQDLLSALPTLRIALPARPTPRHTESQQSTLHIPHHRDRLEITTSPAPCLN
ncbi:hypothetical protein L228DRAFT_91398 [Xylona heveae TC161]|uniref:Uncharacterized protein n=1 Tax=Xylona heveae (strain CBS 132557 / TC161) TaxID=1328760 RepID=A0A165I0J3_XYLHT|nr:hypothetical protein L228DRAFT_91398 [Xylona heveae TC161]KZF24189.1 hypothetical protein L228DRAFT_91398 [Xylona heveae TC161]